MIVSSKYYNEKDIYSILEKKLNGFSKAIASLGEKGYITNDGFGIVLTEKAMELFNSNYNEKWFLTFWNKYPTIVGDRRLKFNRNNCEKVFKLKIKSEESLNELLRGLEQEISERTRAGDMRFFCTIERWLKEERWKAYLTNDTTEPRSMKDDI